LGKNPKFNKIILIMVFIILCLTPALLFAQSGQNKVLPLLLTSGLVDCDKGEVEYIVWTEDPLQLFSIENILRSSSLTWQRQTLSDFSGREVYQYFAKQNINKENEKEGLQFYCALYSRVAGKTVHVYMEEKVYACLNAEQYFQENNIPEIQSVSTKQMTSINGYDRRIPGAVRFGKEETNIQIITNGEVSDHNRVILALPALIEEF